jgi:hypothetical protein
MRQQIEENARQQKLVWTTAFYGTSDESKT